MMISWLTEQSVNAKMNSAVLPSTEPIQFSPNTPVDILNKLVIKYKLKQTRCTVMAVLFTSNLLAHSTFITR